MFSLFDILVAILYERMLRVTVTDYFRGSTGNQNIKKKNIIDLIHVLVMIVYHDLIIFQ